MILLALFFNFVIGGVLWYNIFFHNMPASIALLVQGVIAFFSGCFITMEPRKDKAKPNVEEDLTRRQIYDMTSKNSPAKFCPACAGLGWIEADVGQIFECSVCNNTGREVRKCN